MDFSASGYSGGGESGWTIYLDQSYVSKDGNGDDRDYYCYGRKGAVEEGEEEEDLSMVSDASSGPRYHNEDDEDCCYEGYRFSSRCSNELAKKKETKHNSKERSGRIRQQHSCLDDTASSPAQGFPKKDFSTSRDEVSMQNVLGFSQGFSRTKFKGKSTFREHLGFLHSAHAGKPASEAKGIRMQRRNKG